jgi:RND family efflux transporter MFP subunit
MEGFMYSRPWLVTPAVACLAFSLSGCTGSHPPSADAGATPVTVSTPVEKEVTDFQDFTGRTAAPETVEVRAHVWGFIDKINFTEGSLVKEGDVLFEIEPTTYQAAVDQAKARVALEEAKAKYSESDYKRNVNLPRAAVSQDEVDRSRAAVEVSKASVDAAKADLVIEQQRLDYTKVTAKIGGRIGRAQVTKGNLVQSGATGGTVLTTIVSLDPMYAYFDVDERTLLRVMKLIREGKIKGEDQRHVKVTMALAEEVGFPHKGEINFIDNQVGAGTGTIRLRATFPNEDLALTAGLFCRVRVPIGEPHKALLITDRAVETDQGQKIVYVVNTVNGEDKVEVRNVTLGQQHDGLRTVTEGLTAGDRVIVEGVQSVRPGVLVAPGDPKPMPVSKVAAGDAAKP